MVRRVHGRHCHHAYLPATGLPPSGWLHHSPPPIVFCDVSSLFVCHSTSENSITSMLIKFRSSFKEYADKLSAEETSLTELVIRRGNPPPPPAPRAHARHLLFSAYQLHPALFSRPLCSSLSSSPRSLPVPCTHPYRSLTTLCILFQASSGYLCSVRWAAPSTASSRWSPFTRAARWPSSGCECGRCASCPPVVPVFVRLPIPQSRTPSPTHTYIPTNPPIHMSTYHTRTHAHT